MNIKYVEGSRSITDKYIKSRIDFITKFCGLILPMKISNDKSIRSKLYNYYIITKFDKYNITDEIIRSNSSLLEIFKSNNIRIKELQELCFCLIDLNTLFDWKNKTSDAKELKYKKSLIDLATTIYIALQYDKYMLQSKSINANEINKEIIKNLKGLVDVELLIKINEKIDSINSLIESTTNNNNKFIDELKEYTLFKGKLIKINNPNNNIFVISELDYSIKEFKDDNKKEVEKISNRENIRTNLNKIKVDINSLYLVMNILKGFDIKLIIELNNGFVSSDSNISYLLNRIDCLSKYVYLSINYDCFSKYSENIDKLNAYSIIVNLNEKNVEDCVNFKGIPLNEYIILNYSDNEMFGKMILNITGQKLIPIIKGVPSKNIASNKKYEYYTITGVK